MNRFFERIKILFSYWKIIKNVYDFDYSGILLVEQHQLKRTIKSISKYQNHVDAWHDIKWMKIADNLLDIILSKNKWWDIVNSQELFDEMMEKSVLDDTFKPIYKIDVYINTRNSSRFGITKLNESSIICLREIKAWKLYHKIRNQYMLNWWD